jgi:hypothetical protein
MSAHSPLLSIHRKPNNLEQCAVLYTGCVPRRAPGASSTCSLFTRKEVAIGTVIVSSIRSVCVDGCCVEASGLSLLAEQLSAFQGGLCCLELLERTK